MLALVHNVEPFRPRQCQEDAKAAFLAYTGTKGALVVLPTGVGKTGFGHYVAVDRIEAGERVLWIADQRTLVDQPYATLAKWWPHLVQYAGTVMADEDECDAQLVYASKDTIRNPKRMAKLLAHGHFSLVIADEAHRSLAPTYLAVIRSAMAPGCRLLGLTATPTREDSTRMSDEWEIVFAYPILNAIADGDLVPPYTAVEMIPNLDLSNVRTTSGGDYDTEDLGRELLKAHIVEHTVAAMQKQLVAHELPFRERSQFMGMTGRRILVHTATVEQARLTAEALTASGHWQARFVSGETPPGEKERLFGLFRENRINVLCSAKLLSVGVDFPFVDGQVFAAPTRSWTLYMQRMGRGLRSFPGKTSCYALDLVNCTKSHSIVAAPVLVDGTDCEESDDGAHRYLAIEGTFEGRCSCCGYVIKCMKLGGSHDFVDGHCKACGSPQCPDAPNKQHHFITWEDNKRICPYCAKEIPDPMAAMVNRGPLSREPVAWRDIGEKVWGADLGKAGVLFTVQHGADSYRVFLHARDRLVPLHPSHVDGRMARLLTDDVARQSTKTKGFYGGHGSAPAARFSTVRMEALARRLRVREA